MWILISIHRTRRKMAQAEVECFPIGGKLVENRYSYDNYAALDCGDLVFSKKTTPYMSALRKHFCKINDFPRFYLGIVKKPATCKDPDNGTECTQDALDIENDIDIETLEIGDEIRIKNTKFYREFIFQGWDTRIYHKLQMRSGIYSFLRQDLVDHLNEEDKQSLGIIN